MYDCCKSGTKEDWSQLLMWVITVRPLRRARPFTPKTTLFLILPLVPRPLSRRKWPK
jgi:hypothetical protein